MIRRDLHMPSTAPPLLTVIRAGWPSPTSETKPVTPAGDQVTVTVTSVQCAGRLVAVPLLIIFQHQHFLRRKTGTSYNGRPRVARAEVRGDTARIHDCQFAKAVPSTPRPMPCVSGPGRQ